jgi:hypothetical protein
MKKYTFNQHLALRLIGALLVVVLIFISFQVVKAALYQINTNDATVQEWFDQGVPIFQTDPAGDVPVPEEDILTTWVATGDNNTFNFMMELNADPALNLQYRQAVAYIDCDMDGDNNGAGDVDDIMIAYDTWIDDVWIMRGDQNQGQSTDANNGERVHEYLEWGLPFSLIPPNNPLINDSDCLSDVQIRFFTSNSETNPAVVIDETTPFKGYNVYPNVVKMDKMKASTSPDDELLNIVLLGLLIGVIVAGLIIILKRRPCEDGDQ